MTEPASAQWSISGEYFENCSCTVACPCMFSGNAPFTSQPTEGACEVTFAFHIDRGTFGNLTLDGLNLGMVARTPGPMIEGNWQVALYVDERADEAQGQAMQAIFPAPPAERWARLPRSSARFWAPQRADSLHLEGKRRAVEIPDIMTVAVHPIPSAMGEDAEMVAVNAHPFAPDGVVMAVGDPGISWSDYGMHWDNSGRNGHYAPIRWSNA